MAERQSSFVQMQANKTEFVTAVIPRFESYFDDFGLQVTDFSSQSITLPDELQEYLRKNTQMNMVGDLDKFLKFQTGTALEKSAENPSGGNAGMDMGAGLAMGKMMTDMISKDSASAPQAQPEESKDDIMKLLKDLGELKASGILTEEEFSSKKKELLDRL